MSQSRIDTFGAVASGLCAVHCGICALLPAVFGAIGAGALMGATAEWMFTGVAIVFASVALLIGLRRHGNRRVAALLLAGIAGLLTGRLIEELGGHHHGAHAEQGEHAEHAERGEHGEHGEHDNHGGDDGGHLLGAGVGVAGGLLLIMGHVFNLRATRRREDCPEDCC